MGRRRGVAWGAATGCLLLGAAGSDAVELRRLGITPTSVGATVEVVLSAPAGLGIHGISAGQGTVSRLYLDLPAGTRLAPAVRRPVSPSPPVTALRVGLGEKGVVRIVLVLAAPASYELRRGGRVLSVALASAAPAVVADAVPPPTVLAGPPTPAAPVLRPKIVLDPGHGGTDPGAEGFAIEKDVTLDVARQVAVLLRTRLGADVILTRSRDATLPLAARTARANAEGADLFLSIHANASRHPRLHGIETYYLNNTHDRATIRLAAMENGLALITPRGDRADLRYILSDLVQVGKMEESVALATAVQRDVVGHLGARYGEVADLGVKRGPFYVLVGAYMPCALVEISFLTHPGEGRRLATRAYRQTIAEGIEAGIARFLADGRRARTL